MGKFIESIFKNDNFNLSKCTDGFYLWDNVQEMNISMYAKTEQAAFIEALIYYQKRLQAVKKDYDELNGKVETFFALFPSKDDD